MQAETRLIGRERELAELDAAVAAAVEGRGQLCLLTGESGIGKTSLADAVATRAEQAGAIVHWGRAWEAGGAPAFWPWVQVIRGLCRGREPAALRELLGAGAPWIAQVVPDVGRYVPDVEPPGSIETDQARFALFDAVTTFLLNVGAEQPLVVLLDDLHAADASSLLMLEFVGGSLRDGRLLVLATYQEDPLEERPEVAKLLVEVARAGRRIPLGRLGQDHLAELVEVQGDIVAQPQLIQDLHATTDGNPFFATEVLRLLAAEGRFDPGRAGGPEMGFPLPETAREAIRRRLEPLGPAVIEHLGVAAIIGREFPLPVLERATGATREALIESLDRAGVAGVVSAISGVPGSYRFRHGLVRSTLYGDLSTGRRIRGHAAVGDALEELYVDDPEPHLAELAHHFLEAAPVGYGEKAVDRASRAAERAMRILAYEEAERLLEGALGALDLLGPDPSRRAELLLALGRAQVRGGDPVARRTLRATAAAARALDRPELLGQAALGFRAFARQAGLVDDEVVGMIEEALERLGPDDSALRARLLVRLAVQLFDKLDAVERRETLVDEAIAIARRLDDPPTVAYVLSNAQLARWSADHVEESRAWAEEVLEFAEQSGDLELLISTRSRQIDILLGLDDIVGADEELAHLQRLVRDAPEPRARAHVAVHSARRALIEGRFEEADRLMDEAAAHGDRASDRAVPAIVAGLRWASHWGQGTLEELEPFARRMIEAAPSVLVWRAGLALILARQGHEAEACAELDRLANHGFADIPRNDNWLIAMATLTEVCALVGDERRAEMLEELLQPFAGRTVLALHGAYMGPVSRYLGLLAATRGDRDTANRQFDAADASAARMGARPVQAMLRVDRALILAAGEGGDRERALDLLTDAERIAAEVGAGGLERRAADERETLSAVAPAPPSRAAAEALTAALRREGEVWVFDYEGRAVRIKDSKGVSQLARLLATPGVEVHALDLVGGAGGASGGTVDGESDLEVRMGSGDAGPALDANAKAAYKSRLDELREEAEEAESFNDPERAARAREEMDFIARELAGAVGLGGRDRKTGSDAERARVNATRSIRNVLKRIAEHDKDLGRELDGTVRTGTFCSYEPDPRRPVSWTVEGG